MYIEYAKDIMQHLSSQNVIDSLDLAATAMREGSHIISTEERDMASQICTFMRSQSIKIASYFDKLNESYSTIASIRKRVSCYIKIQMGNNICRQVGNVIEVSIDKTTTSTFWQKVDFILEHSDDEKYYKVIMKKFASDIPVNYKKSLGGGSTTVNQLLNCSSNGNIVLAIIDSDKKCPGPVENDLCRFSSTVNCKVEKLLGNTANKVIAQKNNLNATCCYYVLNVHEIENLFFSEELLKKFAQHDSSCEKLLHILKQAEQKDPDIWLLFDVKNGYEFKKIKRNKYLKYVFADSMVPCKNIIHASRICQKCNSCDKCECQIDYATPIVCKENPHTETNITCASCSFKVATGLGGEFLKKLFETDFTEKVDDYFAYFQEKIKIEWEKIANIISTWCCCYRLEALGA